MRWITRTIALAGSVLPFLPFTEWPAAMACVTAVSPFISLSAALGGRYFGLITLACLPLIILAFFKHRWFCWHLCPTGFILELTCPRRRSKGYLAAGFPHLGKWLLVLGIGLAAAGYPLLMISDPLNILNGFLSTWQWKSLEWKIFMPAIPLLGLIALNAIRPNLWCHRLCPLGAAQQFLGMAGRSIIPHLRKKCLIVAPHCVRRNSASHSDALQICPPIPALKIPESFPPTGVRRRFFLLALLGGIAGWVFVTKKSGAAVIRPPGAVNENIFTGLCARCGNCINVCPQNIIVPDLGASGLRGLLTPILKYRRGYCDEWCVKCLLACPTSAIRRLSLEQKRITVIGQAQIDKSLCLAWSKHEHCMVCQEFCPYQAIAIVENEVNCPEVKNDVCRGCGSCENHCPAIPRQAITVQSIPVQRIVSVNQAAEP